jgi:hypothetical protein
MISNRSRMTLTVASYRYSGRWSSSRSSSGTLGTRSSSVKTDTKESGNSNEKSNISDPTNTSYG